MGLNPFFAAVATQLLLPDRQTLLDLFDHEPTRREGLVAVWGRSGDRNARLTDGNESHAMLQGDARFRPAPTRLVHDAGNLGERHVIVGGVLDAGDVVIVPHGAEKHARAAALGAVDLGEQRRDGYRASREVRHHPPESGGSSATSSPSLTRTSSFTWRRFSAASGRAGRLRARAPARPAQLLSCRGRGLPRTRTRSVRRTARRIAPSLEP